MEEAIEVAGCLELRWVNKILALRRVEGRKLREPGTYVYVMFSIKTGRVYIYIYMWWKRGGVNHGHPSIGAMSI